MWEKSYHLDALPILALAPQSCDCPGQISGPINIYSWIAGYNLSNPSYSQNTRVGYLYYPLPLHFSFSSKSQNWQNFQPTLKIHNFMYKCPIAVILKAMGPLLSLVSGKNIDIANWMHNIPEISFIGHCPRNSPVLHDQLQKFITPNIEIQFAYITYQIKAW